MIYGTYPTSLIQKKFQHCKKVMAHFFRVAGAKHVYRAEFRTFFSNTVGQWVQKRDCQKISQMNVIQSEATVVVFQIQ